MCRRDVLLGGTAAAAAAWFAPRPARGQVWETAIALGASLLSSALGFFGSGQSEQAEMLGEILELVRGIYGSLENIELSLAEIITKLALLPQVVREEVRAGFDHNDALDIEAVVDSLPSWIRNSRTGSHRLQQGILVERLAQLDHLRRKTLLKRTDFAAPVLISACFAELAALPFAGFNDYEERNAEITAAYHSRFERMLDPGLKGSISEIRESLQKVQAAEAEAIGAEVMRYRAPMRDGTYPWFAFVVPERGAATRRWTRTLKVERFEGHPVDWLFRISLSDGELAELDRNAYPGARPLAPPEAEVAARRAHAELKGRVETFNSRAEALASLRNLEAYVAAALFGLAGGGDALPLSAFNAVELADDPRQHLRDTEAQVEAEAFSRLLKDSVKRADDDLRESAQHIEELRQRSANKEWIRSLEIGLGVLKASLAVYDVVANWNKGARDKSQERNAAVHAPFRTDGAPTAELGQPEDRTAQAAAGQPSGTGTGQVAAETRADNRSAADDGSDQAERLLRPRPRLDLSSEQDRHRAVTMVERIADELEKGAPSRTGRLPPELWTREEVLALSAIETLNAIEKALPPKGGYTPPWSKFLDGSIVPALGVPPADAATRDGPQAIAELRRRLNAKLLSFMDARNRVPGR